jgi:hypothetical protein
MIVTCPDYMEYQEATTTVCTLAARWHIPACEIPPPHLRAQPPLLRIQTSSPLLPCSNLRPRLTRSSSDNHALTQCKLPAALRFKQSSYDCSSWFTKTETQRVCTSRRDIAFVAKIPSSSTMASIQDLSREQSFLASECDTPPGSRSFE